MLMLSRSKQIDKIITHQHEARYAFKMMEKHRNDVVPTKFIRWSENQRQEASIATTYLIDLINCGKSR